MCRLLQPNKTDQKFGGNDGMESGSESLLETVKILLIIVACIAVMSIGYFLFSTVKSRTSAEGNNLLSTLEVTLGSVNEVKTVLGSNIQVSLQEEPDKAVYVLYEAESVANEKTEGKMVKYDGEDTVLVNVGKRYVSKNNIIYDEGQKVFVAQGKMIEDEKVPLASCDMIEDKQKFKPVDLRDKKGSAVGVVYVMVYE